jgi:DNA primase
LSNRDHQLLCALPPPHGPLFRWLDSQSLEHGPQTWGTLREALSGHDHEAFAVEQVSQVPADIENDRGELEGILRKERELLRAEEMRQLSQRAASDPEAFRRYRELVAEQSGTPADPLNSGSPV